MKPTRELLLQTIARIEIELDVWREEEHPKPNVDAAISILQSLAEVLDDNGETPIDFLGLSQESINGLTEAGIESIEQLDKMTATDLLAINRLKFDRVEEILQCLEIYKELENGENV